MHLTWSLPVALSLGLATVAIAAESNSESVEIPLESVWALGMPGTRPVQELELPRDWTGVSDKDRHQLSAHVGIGWSLNPRVLPPRGASAGEAFVAPGHGLDALWQAHAVLYRKAERFTRLSADKECTLVIYSYPAGGYVHLKKAVRAGTEITAELEIVPHVETVVSSHYALIPLGVLPAGKYHVNVEVAPLAQKFVEIGFKPMTAQEIKRSICQSFDFEIVR
jgi:hypothetical protein